jgi:hypothetical protein
MRTLALAGILLGLAGLAAGCGKEIGDECVVDSDCSPNGDRVCDTTSNPGHYCTIIGCDYDTCPSEATCVSFFSGGFANKPCTIATQATDCSLDEICPLDGFCVPRSSEIRYCMKSCDSTSDCRGGYECRDDTLMVAHGGEPVVQDRSTLQTESVVNDHKFCAVQP